VLLTAGGTDAELYDCIAAGAVAVMMKEAAVDELLACLSEVAAGRSWRPSDTVTSALARAERRRSGWQSLSAHLPARERELIPLVLDNKSNKQIAIDLGISEGTVKIHLNSVFRKLGVFSRPELVQLARDQIVR